MRQLEIQYFFPLTEQIPLDLDFRPSYEYDAKKRAEMIAGSVLTTNGLGATTWATVNVVPDTLQFKPDSDCVGYWEVSKGLQVWRKQRPNWLHQKMTKVFFGWEWNDR